MVETCNITFFFSNLISTTQESLTGELVVLVDAYNLCGQWDELKPDFMSGRLSVARDKLIDSLIIYSEVRGFFFCWLEFFICIYALVSML